MSSIQKLQDQAEEVNGEQDESGENDFGDGEPPKIGQKFSVLQIIGQKSKECSIYSQMHQYSGLNQELKEIQYLLNMRDTSHGEF